MMHMWMWLGYNVGEFVFPGLEVTNRWSFALTWIVLFVVALLFEASKVYLARVQRAAQRKLYPYRSDERRNLLCDREQGGPGATTSRNASTATVDRWASLRIRVAVNLYQTLVFLVHNVVGYILMLAVMVYNVYLMLAVVCGMMLGYFLFGTKLTLLQMQCFGSKRVVVCTPECDDTAAESMPPRLLDTSTSSESDFFICQTRTCIQPSHYFPANPQEGTSSQTAYPTCFYGAKKCPSKVARAKKHLQQSGKSSRCHHVESEKEDSPSVEDAQLLRTERQGCCKKKQEPPPAEVKKCGSSASVHEASIAEEKKGCCKKDSSAEEQKELQERETSPQIRCCHTAKSIPAESQEQIIK